MLTARALLVKLIIQLLRPLRSSMKVHSHFVQPLSRELQENVRSACSGSSRTSSSSSSIPRFGKVQIQAQVIREVLQILLRVVGDLQLEIL